MKKRIIINIIKKKNDATDWYTEARKMNNTGKKKKDIYALHSCSCVY